jgi:hypothetical protein
MHVSSSRFSFAALRAMKVSSPRVMAAQATRNFRQNSAFFRDKSPAMLPRAPAFPRRPLLT